jgi:hypothetical protein
MWNPAYAVASVFKTGAEKHWAPLQQRPPGRSGMEPLLRYLQRLVDGRSVPGVEDYVPRVLIRPFQILRDVNDPVSFALPGLFARRLRTSAARQKSDGIRSPQS